MPPHHPPHQRRDTQEQPRHHQSGSPPTDLGRLLTRPRASAIVYLIRLSILFGSVSHPVWSPDHNLTDSSSRFLDLHQPNPHSNHCRAYSRAFRIAIGLFYGVSHLPQVLNWTHFFLKSAASASSTIGQEYSGYDVSQAFIPFIVGIILFVKGRSWAATLARRHNKCTQPSHAGDATHEG
ncbi:MAG: hypothetical protein PHF70_14325 [Opitutales bacterium]|nr:hypothetical protein [Opitutales bacterium]